MVMRQLGGEQDRPLIYARDSWNVEYGHKANHSEDLRIMKETWKECRKQEIWEGGYTDAYKEWRQKWIEDKAMPRKPRHTIYRELMEVKVVVGKLEQQRSEFKVKADRFQYLLLEERKEVRRCKVRIEELDQMYEEMRVSCNDMEEEKEWAEERLESRKEDCWRLIEGKRRLRAEMEELTSYLEEYRAQLQDCRRERDDLKEKLIKAEGETKVAREEAEVAREEAVRYKRKWTEEMKDHRLVAAELEEKNARLAKCEAEYGGVRDVIKLVNRMQELKRKAQMRGVDDPVRGTEELRSLPSVIERDNEIRSIMGRRGWLASHVTNLKEDLAGIADKVEGEYGFMLQDLQGLWVEVEARIERMHEDTIAFVV